jgi:hypothetical protein
MPKKPSPLTAQQIEDWQNHCDDLDVKYEPIDPQNINVAREVDGCMKLFGAEAGARADFRVECSHFQDDKEDWKDVARIIRERQADMAKKPK